MKRFPILTDYSERRAHPDWPVSIPWKLIAPKEAQARANHCGQSLEMLASRGGLGVLEILAVLRGVDFKQVRDIDPIEAMREIMELGGLQPNF